MYIYHYRLFDRYQKPIISLAILGDDRENWRPKNYCYENFGCKISFEFPIIKLLDYQKNLECLENNNNPFSTVVKTHLKALATRQDPKARLYWKITLFKALYQQNYSKKEILELFNFIDWMLVLPTILTTEFKNQVIQYEEEIKMPYVSSIEQMGIEQGIERGIERGIKEALVAVLNTRFEVIPDFLRQTIQNISDSDYLSSLLERAVTVDSIETFQREIKAQEKI